MLALFAHKKSNMRIAWNLPVEKFLREPRKGDSFWPSWCSAWSFALLHRPLKVDLGLDFAAQGASRIRSLEVVYKTRFSVAYSAIGFTPLGAVQHPFHADGLDHRRYEYLKKLKKNDSTHAVQLNYVAPPIDKWMGKLYWGMRLLLNHTGDKEFHAVELGFPLEFSWYLHERFPRIKVDARCVAGKIGWLPTLILPNKITGVTSSAKRSCSVWERQWALWSKNFLEMLKAVGLESLLACMRLSFHIKWIY